MFKQNSKEILTVFSNIIINNITFAIFKHILIKQTSNYVIVSRNQDFQCYRKGIQKQNQRSKNNCNFKFELEIILELIIYFLLNRKYFLVLPVKNA